MRGMFSSFVRLVSAGKESSNRRLQIVFVVET